MSSSAHLIVDQHRYHRGFAKIRLQNLEFSEDAARPPLSQTNIDRLYKIFDLEGCQRLDPDNYVPVLVDHEVLGEALARTGVSEQQLLDPRSLPLLQLGGDSKALVLHGRHRLRAAEKFLTDSTEKWWTIDIFDSGIPPVVRDHIQDKYSKSAPPSDGEVYRRLRQSLLDVGGSSGKWLAQLTPVKRRDVLQLHKKEPTLTAALDTLLPFHGLWQTVELGTLHRILTLRCATEMVRYLTNIHRIWTFILLDNIEMGPLLDATTVAAIETLQPKLSLADAAVVRKLMSSHKIFPYILDGSTRGRILSRLQTLNEPILSLRTFLEDTKLLEVATKPLKRLLGSKQKEGLVHCFRAAHTGTQISITDETSPSSPRRVSSSIFAEDRPYICYLRLVLFCMRYFYGLTGIAPRKERGQSLADIPTENASFVYTKLAYLAQRLGFSTPIMAEMSLPQAEELASMEFLEELCPSDRMNLSALDRSEIARDISSRVQRAQHESREESIPPNFTTNLIELRKDHRMGRPFANSYRHDRKHLFLSKIYGSYNPPRAEYLTTLAVLRYTFIAFFGNGESHTDDYTPLQPTAQTVAMRLSPSASEHGTSETSASPPPTLPSRSRSDTPMSSFGEAFGLSDSPAVDQPSPTSPEPITMAANRPSVYTESIYSQDSISSNEIVAPSLLELARAGRGAVGRRDVTLIDCNTKSSQRVMTKDLQGVFVEAANNGMGFATMVSDTQIERHNVDTVELAAVYNRVVFVYQKQKQGPYIYSDLEGFLQSFER